MSLNWTKLYRSLYCLNTTHSPYDTRHIMAELRKHIDADKLLICVANLGQYIQMYYGDGFSEEDYRFHREHISDNLYLQTYLGHGLTGKSVCLQEMLPDVRCISPEFEDQFWPAINTDYMYGLVIPLDAGWHLRLSCYRTDKPFPPDFAGELNALGAGLIGWAALEAEFHNTILGQGVYGITEEHLTPSECQVLHLLSKGMDGSEIAQYRNVSKETVKSQIKSLLHKTHCRHQNELLSRLYEWKGGSQRHAT